MVPIRKALVEVIVLKGKSTRRVDIEQSKSEIEEILRRIKVREVREG